MVGLFLISLAATGDPINEWVRSYDPDGHGGRGTLTSTPRADRALTFPDVTAALTFYHQRSTRVPQRMDGRPNRPLTAYTVDIRPLPE